MKPLHRFAACVLAALSFASSARAEGEKLLDLVNPLQGTDSTGSLSHGGTLPLVGPPWPMTHWAPQTVRGRRFFETGGWWFQSNATDVYGLRATHQPSPWMGDYGSFSVQPATGEVVADPQKRASTYDRDNAVFAADYLKLKLTRYDVQAELTASERCAVMRFTFDKSDTGRLYFDPARTARVEIDGRVVRGYTTQNNGGVPKNWRAYFVARLDRDVTATGTFDDKQHVTADGKTIDGDRVGAFIEFKTEAGKPVVLSVATSYISYEQAEQNLKSETDGGFDATRERTAAAWEKNLGRARVAGGTPEQRRTFYSCLYRAQTFPHKLHEVDANGKAVHFSVYDGKLHDGPAYGDIGFWDVYRTNFSLWSLVYPEQLEDILNGFALSAEESGWFPQWPSPGHRSGMIGSHVDAVYADAIAKNIGGFDREKVYANLRKHAFDRPPNGSMGRPGYDEHVKLGYVPAGKDAGYSVSCTLDYAYDDWCLAQIAKTLGKTEDHDTLIGRAKFYKNLWDPSVGFFRPKKSDGTWFGPFDEFAWSTGFCEGGPWQGSWAVQHDVEGLAELFGGKKQMGEKLDRMLGQAPIFHIGEYGGVIHEMTEMAIRPFGQYAHGNQPVHHVLYLFTSIGQPYKTQYWTRRVCQELYTSGPDGFAGDEDNGEMGSWYVLSSMGLYQVCVGDPTYTLTSPLFDEVTLSLSNGKTLKINAADNAPLHHYVQSRTLDGKPFAGDTIAFERLREGGTLNVRLGSRPPGDEPKRR